MSLKITAHDQTMIESAQAAITANAVACRLEGDAPPSVDLYHMLYALMTWARANDVNFDHVISDVAIDFDHP